MSKCKVFVEVVSNVAVAYCLPGQADDEEAAKLIAACQHPGVTKLFSVQVGIMSVNAKQRAQGAKVLEKFDTIVFILDNPLTRGVARAMSWLGIKSKVFSPQEMEQAIGSLGLTEHEAGRVRATLERLRRSSVYQLASVS